MTKAVEGFVKSVPLVWGLVVRLLVVPGVIRASVGVDCLVPCPPSVAPRTLNPWGGGGGCRFPTPYKPEALRRKSSQSAFESKVWTTGP